MMFLVLFFKAAKFARDNINKTFQSKLNPATLRLKTKLEAAITSAYQEVDKEYFLKEQQEEREINSGSTALSLIVNLSRNLIFHFTFSPIF